MMQRRNKQQNHEAYHHQQQKQFNASTSNDQPGPAPGGIQVKSRKISSSNASKQ